MMNKKLLGIEIDNINKTSVLEKIKKYIGQPLGFFHIVSLNPENMVVAYENPEFKRVIETAQIKLIDGIGIVLAGRLLGFRLERLTGTELMGELIRLAGQMSLTVLLIGGKPNLALRLAQCQQKKYPEAKFLGVEGIKNIKNPKEEEEEAIFSIVRTAKPNIVIASFGSPDQELWLARHSKQLSGIVCMGVGGAFDYFGGTVLYAPLFIRKIGLEWLFRLLVQPWRWRRQMRLIKFIQLVIRQRFSYC